MKGRRLIAWTHGARQEKGVIPKIAKHCVETLRITDSDYSVTGRLGGGEVDSTADGISREKGYM